MEIGNLLGGWERDNQVGIIDIWSRGEGELVRENISKGYGEEWEIKRGRREVSGSHGILVVIVCERERSREGY